MADEDDVSRGDDVVASAAEVAAAASAAAAAAQAALEAAAPPPLTGEGLRSTKAARVAALDVSRLPGSFTRNSMKEGVTLEYLEHFDAQFRGLYPERRPLLLCPANEAGVRKFVCTSLRPALAPARELYDAPSAARFVSLFMAYEPLEAPARAPRCVPSPLFSLHARRGDAFDLSLLLASLLLGGGYDAYVVVGTAPAWVTLKLEDRSLCSPGAWTLPPDAVDRATHTGPAALGFAPGSVVGGGGAWPGRCVRALHAALRRGLCASAGRGARG